MGGLRFLRHVGIAVPVAIAAASVAAMAPAATPPALAFNGGDAQWNAVDLPCVAPCSFPGDNTGDGLSPYPTDTAAHEHATWWTFVADENTSHTIRAAALAPSGWHTTLVLTDLDGTVLAADDDPYGRDAVVTATLMAGNEYLLALAGHDAADQGTAQITLTTGTPDAPVDLTAAPRTGAALLGWTAPDDHGSAITEYRVYVDGNTTYTVVPAPATSTTVSGLTIGTGVAFTITAVNAQGESARTTNVSATPYGLTTTELRLTPSNVVWPSALTVSATVKAEVPVADGTVTFWKNSVNLGDFPLLNGTAQLPTQSLNPGTYTFIASYSGGAYL